MADDQNPELPLTPPPGGGDGTGVPGALNIQPVNIEEEMKKSYLDYSMSVIIGRALPDVRDGLKPVHRRILYTMQQMGLYPNRSTRKCARIVGDVMGKYHPHGNLAVYDALVRLAQPFAMRYPLVEGQGNFGSVDGDPPAADRYTEARLARVSNALLEDLDKATVDFRPNYDGNEIEPDVLPTRVPNLLVNGSDGIAVGMATEIPPHNLKEVCAGVLALIDNPDISLAELIRHVPGPDFPTGGEIRGRQGIIEGYRTGRGRITLRARCEVVEGKRAQIIIREVPFQQTRNRLAEQIGELVKDERIKGIDEVRDESSPRMGEPVRIVVYLKKDVDPHLVLNQLYEYSPLQKTVSIILLALVDGRPKVLTLKEMMQEFLKHRVQVIRRRTEFLLREAKRR